MHRDGETTFWRRGFIDAVYLHAGRWLAHSEAIMACHPVTEVRLTTLPGRAVTLFAGSQFTPPTPGWLLSDDWVEGGEATVMPDFVNMIRRVLENRWPDIRFALPAD
jgi:hypothetical protein